MRNISMFCLTFFLATATAAAQTASPDSQVAQVMLTEFRQLRQDLQNTAATIQRVQIVMYRLQTQGTLLERAATHLEEVRSRCKQEQEQQKMFASEMEQAEVRKRNSQNASDQRAAEQTLFQLKSYAETRIGEAQQCQGEQSDAENQFRSEQAKMDELQNLLDQLDHVLAGNGRK